MVILTAHNNGRTCYRRSTSEVYFYDVGTMALHQEAYEKGLGEGKLGIR
jgi:hypothetical protein